MSYKIEEIDLYEKPVSINQVTGQATLNIPTDFSINDSYQAGHDYLRR